MAMPRTICAAIVLALCVRDSVSFNPDNLNCCDCSRMTPTGVADLHPQILPSPFKIIVDPAVRKYSPGGEDINVNLTSTDENRSFRFFHIQARRTNASSFNVDEPVGTFSLIQPGTANGVDTCQRQYGSGFQSVDYTLKKNVVLAWNPPNSFQGHIEFRVTFIEDDKVYWVREKSRLIYDPTMSLPPLPPVRYLPPPIPPIDVSGCGSTKGCYRLPEDCVELECEYILTWARHGTRIRFEMSAITDGFSDRYIAFGLSDNTYMDDDLVFECVHDGDSVEIFQSINSPEGNANKRLNSPKVGLSHAEGSYHNGRIRCRFTRDENPNDAELAGFKLGAKPWHLLLARGPTAGAEIRRHGMTVGHLPVASPDPVDLLGYDDISGRARYPLVKAHACLMLLAWVFFAPIGLIWMKYYSTMWPNRRIFKEKYWFVAHFNCTFWVILLVVIGVILIFIEADGWSKFPELPQKAHPILGIIVLICMLIIPILALIQCPEDHTCRPVGNWFYWLFWTIAYCLAIPNIFIGCDFGKATVPWWLTWILCIFFLFHLICEVILEVHQCCTHKKNKERRKKYELQKKENPKVHIPEPWPADRTFKRNVLYTHFIVCLIVVLIAVITVAVS